MKKRQRKRIAGFIGFVLALLFFSTLLLDAHGAHDFWWNSYTAMREAFGDGGMTIVLMFAIGSAAFAAGLALYERMHVPFSRSVRFSAGGAPPPTGTFIHPLVAAGLSFCVYYLSNQVLVLLCNGAGSSPGLLSGVYDTMYTRARDMLGTWGSYIVLGILWAIPTFFPALWMFHLLSTPRNRSFRESRCRKCGYILRGLSAPRCPECGEAI